jgi:hypothetical protein
MTILVEIVGILQHYEDIIDAPDPYSYAQNYQQAVDLDKNNGNTKWQDAKKLELDQINEYDRGYIQEMAVRESKYTSSMLSNTVVVTRQDWLQEDI